ncbi:microfibrillar-associated protein MFAP1, Zn finger, CCHC type protein [Ceratobasidium sp. AG-Ba]|nr:microfibrillar-associated protein MFAP1, Zn finger, CCHC type protein [Ceratobasidium sp. AG-Ba]
MQNARKPAAPRPARAAGRYWKGKAPKGADAALSDSDSDAGHEEDVGEEQEEIGEDEFELAGKGEVDGAAAVKKGVAKMSVALKDVDVRDGKVYVGGQEEEESEESEEEEEGEDKPPGAESGSSEYESSSEESEEEPPKPLFRPVFVPKRARETIKKMEAESEFSEEAIRKREIEAAERKKASHDLVAESIKRELAEKETAENVPDVDDTDGVDPAAEFEAWRARELARISRDAAAAQAREEERLERERRAALPEEVRLKEDQERADKSRADKPKGQQKFLQKYWHKGAFHQDAEILKRHDFTEATESTVDASALPSVMQVKNFGKRGQTKYTHLRDQDTTVKLGEFGAAGLGKGPRPAGAIVPIPLKRPVLTHLSIREMPLLRKRGEQADPRTLLITRDDQARVGKIGMMIEMRVNRGGETTRVEVGTMTRTVTGVWATEIGETGLRAMVDIEMMGGGGILHPAGETKGGGKNEDATRENGTTGVDDPGPEKTAANTRHLAGTIDLTRGDGWRHSACPNTARLYRPDIGPGVEINLYQTGFPSNRATLVSLSLMPPQRVVKVAIVGSGLAGLSAAYLLSNTSQTEEQHVVFDVHIFEKSSVLGMDAESVTIRVPGTSGDKYEEIRVDVPMRSIQGGPYPKLIKFYENLGVKLKLHDYSYSFSKIVPSVSRQNPITTQMIYNGASGREGLGIPSSVLQARRLSSPIDTLAMLASMLVWAYSMLGLFLHYVRLFVISRPSARTPTHLCHETLREWAVRTTQQNFLSRLLGWESFVADVIVPLFSAVCTTSIDDVWKHPAGEILDYIWLTFGTHHYVAAHGVQDIVSRLISSVPTANIHLDAEVLQLTSAPEPGTACLNWKSERIEHTTRTLDGFSHIILATPTSHTARLVGSFASSLEPNSSLRGPLNKAVQLLNTFRTRNVIVVTHRDESVLPNHRSDWRDLNLVMNMTSSLSSKEPTPANQSSSDCVMATHIFPTTSGPALCQTTNPIITPLDQTVLSRSTLPRSVLNLESKVARDSFCKPLGDDGFRWTKGELQGLKAVGGERPEARVWVCGAWAYGGIPLLEGCVGSAEIVIQGILEEEGLQQIPPL